MVSYAMQKKKGIYMEYVKRFFIIILISFVGELLNYLLPLPVPGSIYGFVILFVLLLTKVIKLDYIKPATDFLLNIMPLTFIAPGVALITMVEDLKEILLPLLIACTVGTAIVMASVGVFVEKIMKKGGQD